MNQGYALSPLLLCIALNPWSTLLDKNAYGYKFKGGTTINHLVYISDTKIYARNEQDINSLINLTQVFYSTLATEKK